MWIFHDFSITQILCEIKFEDSRRANFAIYTHLEALNFDLHECLHFLQTAIYQIQIRAPKMAETAVLELLHCP